MNTAKLTGSHIMETEHSTFLMVEDDSIDAEIIANMLTEAFGNACNVVQVGRYEDIVPSVKKHDIDTIILDLHLPDSSGVNNVSQISNTFPEMPIVVLTGSEDMSLALESLQHGAQDYLSKNKVTADGLLRSIQYAKERKSIELKLKAALEESAKTNKLLQTQSRTDSLTGVANRAYFREVAERIIAGAQRKELKTALLYFDLNDFKKINDTFGHHAGDELLKQVSHRLLSVVRSSDLVARLGGDEFVVITDPFADKEDIEPLIRRIQSQFSTDFSIGPHRLTVNTSIGIAYYPDADSVDLLIKYADSAMYEAKRSSSLAAYEYSGELKEQYSRDVTIESSLVGAIENSEFSAEFQPVVSVFHDTEIHVEALARWTSTKLGRINPDEFIPIAEKTPAINGITREIVIQAKKLFVSLQKQGLALDTIAINVSASQLTDPQFCHLFLTWLAEVKLPPHHVCLELTERQIVKNFESCKKQFAYLRSKGVLIALDDFGSGFSSITHLLDLHFDILKLDRVLIDHIDQSPRKFALVSGITEMAHRMDMKVVAEGIEREEERDIAVQIGCDYLQGYYISRPATKTDTASFFNPIPA